MRVMGPFEQFLLIVAGAATICWVAYVLANVVRRRDQLRAASEFQLRLLERAGTAREFAEVLNSEAGAKLMDALATEREVRPQVRIFRTFRLAIVLFCIGLFALVYWHEGYHPGVGDYASAGTLGLIATLLLGTGVALVIAAWLSSRFARKAGMLDGRQPAGEQRSEGRSGRTSS